MLIRIRIQDQPDTGLCSKWNCLVGFPHVRIDSLDVTDFSIVLMDFVFVMHCMLSERHIISIQEMHYDSGKNILNSTIRGCTEY